VNSIKLKYLAVLIFCFLFFTVQAQQLRGKIFSQTQSSKKVLAQASIKWHNSDSGTISNANGVFEIPLIADTLKKLIVSHIGFKADTILIKNETYVSITLMEEEIASLKEVLVSTGNKFSFISSTNPIKTEVITQKELTKSACCDLAGCFETQITVQPQTTNVVTNTKELRILGLSGIYNQLLFDGMPLMQGLTQTYGISNIQGSLVDNIYVVKGTNSVLQGFESISGQINVIPKSPEKTDKLFINMYMNSFLEKHFNVNYANNVGATKKWNMLLAAHVVQPAQTTDRDGDNFLDLPKLTRYSLYNKWKYGSETTVGFFTNIGLRIVNEQRVGGQINFDVATQKGTTLSYGQTVNYVQPELYTRTGYKFNDKHAIVLIASTHQQNQESYFGTLKYNANQVNSYFNLQHEFNWQNQSNLKYGISYRHQILNEEIAFTNNSLMRTYDGKYTTKLNVPGVFAENTTKLNNDKIVWIVGIRLDKHQQYGTYLTPRSLLKINVGKNGTLRASVGTGWRQVNLFSENINLLASSRDVIFEETIKPEQAFNWGINYTHKIIGNNFDLNISADYFQTQFQNQFFPDYDRDAKKAFIRNFTGNSTSNSFQIEASIRYNKILESKIGYSNLDVFRVENNMKNVLPFNPSDRVMWEFSYRPTNDKWFVDANIHWVGTQRLPNTSNSPTAFRAPSFSKSYTVVNAQITHKVKELEIYVGCENLFDFRQLKPIVNWQNPFDDYFDTSSVWGPTRGREVYIGFRWRMK
jgi:outer membrane receptor for ferrienterochelin and colicins